MQIASELTPVSNVADAMKFRYLSRSGLRVFFWGDLILLELLGRLRAQSPLSTHYKTRVT